MPRKAIKALLAPLASVLFYTGALAGTIPTFTAGNGANPISNPSMLQDMNTLINEINAQNFGQGGGGGSVTLAAANTFNVGNGCGSSSTGSSFTLQPCSQVNPTSITGNTTISTTAYTGYNTQLALTGNATITIAAGALSAAGQFLILSNSTTYTATLAQSGVTLTGSCNGAGLAQNGAAYLAYISSTVYYCTYSTGSTGGTYSGAANLVLATPNGSSGTATLRALVSGDLPAGSGSSQVFGGAGASITSPPVGKTFTPLGFGQVCSTVSFAACTAVSQFPISISEIFYSGTTTVAGTATVVTVNTISGSTLTPVASCTVAVSTTTNTCTGLSGSIPANTPWTVEVNVQGTAASGAFSVSIDASV